VRLLRRLFGDGLTRAALIIWLIIIGLVAFNFRSTLPEPYPLFGVFDFLMVPVLFIAGGVVFILAIWRFGK